MSKWECPEHMRECPHGWSDCQLCANLNLCMSGLYRPFEEVEPIIIAAEIAEKIVINEAIESAIKIKGMQEETDFWGWWGRTSPPNIHEKEPWKTMSGPTAPGGSKTGKIKKSNKGTKIPIEPWTSQV